MALCWRLRSKSIAMPLKRNHDFKEKCPYVRLGTFLSISITDILTKNGQLFFVRVLEKDIYNDMMI